MNVNQHQAPLVNRAHSRTRSYGSRRSLACGLGLALLFAADILLLEIRSEQQIKVDANRVLSPWDVSKAPPQCAPRDSIKVEKPPAPDRQALAKADKPADSVADGRRTQRSGGRRR